MTIRWNAFEMQVEEPDGNIITEGDLYGRVLENGGVVQLKVVERTRTFNTGGELVLESRDLKEVCLSALTIGQRMFLAAVALARESGILKEAVDDSLDKPRAV